MREIKFRAWDKKEKKIRDIGLIDFLEKECWGVSYISWKTAPGYTESKNIDKYDFSDVELMQFTGLKDKHGKEIYEGDILAYTREEQIISIRWDGSGANWQFDEHDNSFDDGVGRGNWGFNFGVAKHCEIIGNIYQNPDLLK